MGKKKAEKKEERAVRALREKKREKRNSGLKTLLRGQRRFNGELVKTLALTIASPFVYQLLQRDLTTLQYLTVFLCIVATFYLFHVKPWSSRRSPM